MSMKIVHISDLHFASAFFVPEWCQNVRSIISSERPELLIVTGDITDDGYVHQYDLAKPYLDSLDADRMLAVPGNHDARNLGYAIFEDVFGTRFPTFENDLIIVHGVDSAEPDIDDGHVGREHYPEIQRLGESPKLRILALHHHLIPIPGTGRERQIPTDAGDVLGVCRTAGVNIVLSGHKHQPWIWDLGGTFYITTGTAMTRRLKGRYHPSIRTIEVDEEEVTVDEYNVASKERQEALRFARSPEGEVEHRERMWQKAE